MSKIKILDVTLRDGSYVIDFQFTKQDTALICKLLEIAGIKWIEIGHGLGMNASSKYGQAASSDEEYMSAASENLVESKWGMFFIPGIATKEHLDIAKLYGIHFIRIGTNVNEYKEAIPFIEYARKLGILVAYNAMKSYAVSPEYFAQVAAEVNKAGAEIVYLVDSAGGLFPDDIENYIFNTKEKTDIPIGFHGHDNLCMAIANTLKALECGAEWVDTSILGMGRSGGNAKTEVLIAILKQKKLCNNVDLNLLIDIGNNVISPLLEGKGIDPLAVIAGYAMFHSSFTPKVSSYAQKYGLDVKDLIVELCKSDKLNASDEVLEKISLNYLHQKYKDRNTTKSFIWLQNESIQLEDNPYEQMHNICKNLKSNALKFGKNSVLNLVFDTNIFGALKVSRNIQMQEKYVCGSLCISNPDVLDKILPFVEQNVDILFLDSDEDNKYGYVRHCKANLQNTIIIRYSDTLLWVKAVQDLLIGFLEDNPNMQYQILVYGKAEDKKYSSFKENLQKIRLEFSDVLHFSELEKQSEKIILISWDKIPTSLFREIENLAFTNSFLIIDASLNSFEGLSEVDKFKNPNLQCVRLNMWHHIFAEITALHQLHIEVNQRMGRNSFEGINVVSGGLIGNAGDIVVDNYQNPRRIIGIADGKGRIKFDYNKVEQEKVNRLENIINNLVIYGK